MTFTRRNYSVLVYSHGEFPMDMLRHDSASAFSSADQMLIERLNDEGDAKADLAKFVTIHLTSDWRAAPNVARWESFGVKVTWCSDARIELSAGAREARALEPSILRERSIRRIRDAVVAMRRHVSGAALISKALAEAVNVAGCDKSRREPVVQYCAGMAAALEDVSVTPQAYGTKLTLLRALLELTRDILASDGETTKAFCLMTDELISKLEAGAKEVTA